MQTHVTHRPATALGADLLAVPIGLVDPKRRRLTPRLTPLDRVLDGRLDEVVRTGDFRGKRGETLLLYPGAAGGARAARVLLIGLGDETQLDAQGARETGAIAVSNALQRGAKQVALLVPPIRRLRVPVLVQALVEGATLAGYRFDKYRSQGDEPRRPVEGFTVAVERAADVRTARAAAAIGASMAESQNVARDLSNAPPNLLPPKALARAAQQIAKDVGLRCRILDVPEQKQLKMGALLAVGGGSANPPQVIVLEHGAPARGARAGRRRAPICLIGKGVTFDSGGLSIKPTASMVTMKHDMSGGAAVIGALRACALLKLPLHVVGIVGAVENMPSGTAYRPDDILTSMSGKTIEIGNTDAEGRLVLADLLHFAKSEYQPAAMVDVATLTGACSVALGRWAAAVLANQERISDAIRRAGELAGERFWPLPLWDVHREHMRSQVADVRQVAGRDGGTITAAAFLWHFAGDDVPWAHLDIASTANTDRTNSLQGAGGTGFAVRTLVEFLRGWRDPKSGR